MDSNWKKIFGLAQPMALMQQADLRIDPAPSGAMLRARLVRREKRLTPSFIRESDWRDAMMAFALTFTGAMLFLI